MGVSHALWHAHVHLCVCLQINTTHKRMWYWGSVVLDRCRLCRWFQSKTFKGEQNEMHLLHFLVQDMTSPPRCLQIKKYYVSCCRSQPGCCRGHSGSPTLRYHGAISLLCCSVMILSSFTHQCFLCGSGVCLALASFVPQQETWGWSTLWQIRRLCSPHVICGSHRAERKDWQTKFTLILRESAPLLAFPPVNQNF